MNAFIYYDGYQEVLGKEIKSLHHEIRIIQNDGGTIHFDETKIPAILILVSQPSEELTERLLSYPWSFFLVQKGIRFQKDDMYHFDTIESFSLKLKQGLEHFRTNLFSLYESYHPRKPLEEPVARRIKFSPLKGVYTICGGLNLMDQLVRSYSNQMKHQKILAIDGNLIKPSFDRLYGVSSLFTKIKSQLKGVDNTGFNILYDAVNKNIPLEGILSEVTMRHREGFEYLLGNYNIFNYEHYQLETFSKLLNILKKNYDVVFVNSDTYISDSFSLLCYNESEKIIFSCESQVESIRYIKQFSELLMNRQNISKEKILIAVEKKRMKIEPINTMYKNVFGKQFTTSYNPNKMDKLAMRRICRAMGG